MKLIYEIWSVLVIFIIKKIYIIVPHEIAVFIFPNQSTEH